jgi:phage-related protein
MITEYNWQTKSSFLFGAVDMYQTFGLQIAEEGLPEDVLKPQLRERKVVVPMRNGAYDYGAKYYDERPLTITCVTVKAGTRDDAREMAYTLSKKSQIRFWNEPDKYYVGRIYAAPGLEVLRKVGNRFTLQFVLEPFAYGQTVDNPFTGTHYTPNYIGTAPTPTYIVIENTGSETVRNIQIIQSVRRE